MCRHFSHGQPKCMAVLAKSLGSAASQTTSNHNGACAWPTCIALLYNVKQEWEYFCSTTCLLAWQPWQQHWAEMEQDYLILKYRSWCMYDLRIRRVPTWLQPWQHHWAEMKQKRNHIYVYYIYAKWNAYEHGCSLGSIIGLKWNQKRIHIYYIISHLCKRKCLPAWQPWQRHWAKKKQQPIHVYYITSMQNEMLTSMAALATSLGWASFSGTGSMSSRSVVMVVYVAGGYTVTTLMPLSLKNCISHVRLSIAGGYTVTTWMPLSLENCTSHVRLSIAITNCW